MNNKPKRISIESVTFNVNGHIYIILNDRSTLDLTILPLPDGKGIKVIADNKKKYWRLY